MMTDPNTPRSYAAQEQWLRDELNRTRPQADGRRHMLESILSTVREARQPLQQDTSK